jgi:hypothetical protein
MTVQHCIDAIGKVFLAVTKKKICESGRKVGKASKEGNVRGGRWRVRVRLAKMRLRSTSTP